MTEAVCEVNKVRRKLLIGGIAAATTPKWVYANSYPSKPIRVVVPWPAGGVADVSTRRSTARLEPALGQSIVIENRVGASGMLGSEYVSKAAPDGYTPSCEATW